MVIFAALLAITLRRGTIDPVCGMAVDRSKALTVTQDGETFYFCSSPCCDEFRATASQRPPAAVTEPVGEH